MYAFGHPFFNSGPVNMPMAKARILTTLSSLQHSRKFSSTGQIIGAIRQDRPSGIMGVIGEDAPVYPVRVEYTSPFETARVFNYKIAKDKSLSDFSSIFLWFTLLTTLETARFSTGDYNLNMDAKIMLNGDEDIIIRNVYTSAQFGEAEGGGTDIMAAATDVVMVLMPLVSNIFQYPDIEKLDLKFNASPGRQNLAIEKIWYDKTEILPGDDLKLRIQVRGYQEEASIIHHNISIPEYISGSRLAIAVGSADYIRRLEQNINPAKFRPQSYNELLDFLNNRKKNNQIYIQLLAMEKGAFVSGKELSDLPPSMLNIFKSPKVKGEKTKMNQAVLSERQIPMDYRVFGGETISIRISKYRTF